MIETANIKSLTDFNRNSREHIDRLRESGAPELLTVNGQASIVVQDAAAYQQLLKKVEFAETVNAIRAGMDAHERGEGIPMRKALEKIATEAGFSITE